MTVKYASFSGMVNDLHLRRKTWNQHALKGSLVVENLVRDLKTTPNGDGGGGGVFVREMGPFIFRETVWLVKYLFHLARKKHLEAQTKAMKKGPLIGEVNIGDEILPLFFWDSNKP